MQFGQFLVTIEYVDQLEYVRYNFIAIVQCQQEQCNTLESHEISECDKWKTANGMNDFRLLVFFLHFLQVQFRQHVEVVRQLNDEK